jgi:Bacterial Ig-like domain (group 1)
VTFQATDTTDGNVVLDSEAVVTFGNPPAPPPDAAFCSVAANPTSVPADGAHTATVSVLLYDANGDPVTGKAVALAGTGGNSKVTATNATTNNSGIATFAVSDTTAESVKYTATDTTDNMQLSALSASVTFTAAAAGSTTTTTTTSSSATTTTTTATNAAAPVATSAGSSAGGTTGNTGTASSSPTLAATGAGTLLPWLIVFGLLFLGLGTIGRRRFRWQRPANEERDEA